MKSNIGTILKFGNKDSFRLKKPKSFWKNLRCNSYHELRLYVPLFEILPKIGEIKNEITVVITDENIE